MLNTRWFFRCMGHHPHFSILLVTQLGGLFLKWLNIYALIWKWHFNHYFQHLMASKWSLPAAGAASRMLYHIHQRWNESPDGIKLRAGTVPILTILTQPPSLQWIKYAISQTGDLTTLTNYEVGEILKHESRTLLWLFGLISQMLGGKEGAHQSGKHAKK